MRNSTRNAMRNANYGFRTGRKITEFVGLRAKLYPLLMDKGEEKKKCKGINKPVIKKCISFSDYKKCLLD